MVTMLQPSSSAAGAAHERIARPSRSTVQAPYCATPQPCLVPVSPGSSRSTRRSGTSLSRSTGCAEPLT